MPLDHILLLVIMCLTMFLLTRTEVGRKKSSGKGTFVIWRDTSMPYPRYKWILKDKRGLTAASSVGSFDSPSEARLSICTVEQMMADSCVTES